MLGAHPHAVRSGVLAGIGLDAERVDHDGERLAGSHFYIGGMDATLMRAMVDEREPKYPGDRGVIARVIGPSASGRGVRVIVGASHEQLDGGVEHELSLSDVPPDLRVPNAELRLVVATDGGFIVHRP